MVTRGDVHWADLGVATGSGPALRRPVVVVQADECNRSRLATTIVVALTSNVARAAQPGNVFLPATSTGLPKDSVANVTALVTVDRNQLEPHPAGHVPAHLLRDVDDGLRRVLALVQ